MFNFFNNPYKRYYSNLIHETRKDKLNQFRYNKKYSNQDSKLLSLYGECDSFKKKIKLLIIADTHGGLKELDLKNILFQHPEYDACILLGDYSQQDLKIILKYIYPNKIYALLGNHDDNYIKEYNLRNLNGNIYIVNDVSFLGIEGSFRYKNEKFPSFTQKESIEFLNDKPKVDILFSHDAPFELSGINDIAHQGLFGINYYLYKNKVPICIHGHVHIPYDKQLSNGTHIHCSYMLEYVEL